LSTTTTVLRRSQPRSSPVRLSLISSVAAIATIVSAAAAQTTAPQGRSLALSDYLEWEQISEPRISPDGARVIYERRWIDKLKDSWESSIWLIHADGSRNRQLVDGSSAAWSPDGTRIAYLAPDAAGKTQVFVRWMDTEGAVSQITRLTERPHDLAWSPDGNTIAFRLRSAPARPTAEQWRVSLPRPRGAQWTADPRIVESLVYRQDRQGFVEEGFEHIFLVPANGGSPRQVTQGDFDHGAPAWMSDSLRILFDGLRVPGAEYEWGRHSEIYELDTQTGNVKQLTKRRGINAGPVPSPDGKRIAFVGRDWTDDTFFERELYVMDADGSGVRQIAVGLDRTPSDVTWAPDGSGVYFNAEDSGASQLYFAPVTGGPAKRLTEGNHMLSVSGIAAGRTAVATMASPHEPAALVTISLQDPRSIRRLLRTNEALLAGVRLGDVEEVRYRSFDGKEIQGWIVKPPDFTPSRKYPLMLSIHGGPHSMYNVGFNFAWQEHAANGYVVLYTNPRGSSGYGSAFGNAIKYAYPGDDFKDLMAGVDTVVSRGYVDESNMFVYGCSGGGLLTAWVVTQTDRFRAASSMCPVINFLSFGGTVDGNPIRWFKGGKFEKFPWEDPSGHLARSPLMHVGKVKTPVMLMTGVLDLRTPMSQTEEFYQALRAQNKPAAMVRMEGEWHGTSSKPSNFLRTQLYLRKWFERWGTHKRPTTTNTQDERR
jgi:dipeptidyl aminopeptidase/acylaminoacyl peptidase